MFVSFLGFVVGLIVVGALAVSVTSSPVPFLVVCATIWITFSFFGGMSS